MKSMGTIFGLVVFIATTSRFRTANGHLQPYMCDPRTAG